MINTIYVCDTLYQIIVAYCVQKQIQEDAVIIVTDHTCGMDVLRQRIERYTSLFHEAFYVEAKKYSIRTMYSDEMIDSEILSFLKRNSCYDCDHVVIGSLEPYMRRLIKVLKYDLKNADLRIGVIEDGFATYSFFGDILSRYSHKEKISELFIFEPTILSWNTDIRTIKINKKFFENDKFKKELNTIFDYYSLQDAYSQKYIVLSSAIEEITPIKNKAVILNCLADCVGKDNILIKTHPRMNRDYYLDRGYNVNVDTSVPWEIIALNMDLSNKIIISSDSGSLYTPKILFDKQMTGVTVMKIMDYSDPLGLIDYYSRFVCSKYNCFYIPNNMEEFAQIIEGTK